MREAHVRANTFGDLCKQAERRTTKFMHELRQEVVRGSIDFTSPTEVYADTTE